MKDIWQSGHAYDHFMGRWSKLVAVKFLDWLKPEKNLTWVDVGCGSGVLGEFIIAQCSPQKVYSIDQSEGFVQTAQQRLGPRAQCMVGDALDLPLDTDSVDLAVSALVINFIPEPVKAVSEMKRVTRPGGYIASYIWDYPGRMEFLQLFWDAAVGLDERAKPLHESRRFYSANTDYLQSIFCQAGITDILTAPVEIETRFDSFDDYWQPFLGGQGPAPTFVQSLEEGNREQLKALLKDRLLIQSDGSIELFARAWAVRGRV